MEVVRTISETRRAIRRRGAGRVVLVPTMGALHRGHAVLVEEARDLAGEDGLVVVSVFVNPTQFGAGEDFESYPRDLEADAVLCEEAGADLMFAPEAGGMYAADASVRVDEQALSLHLCGESRPGHFSGVCTVVAKLLNITGADIAVFGRKDRQQLAVIERMVRDLDFPTKIVGVPTVREEDGLAMSSRNRYLDDEQRAEAVRLPYGLKLALEAYFAGEREASVLEEIVADTLAPCPFARVDYIEVVDAGSLRPVERVDGDAVLAAAVFFGSTRLIDHVDLTREGCLDESLVPEDE